MPNAAILFSRRDDDDVWTAARIGPEMRSIYSNYSTSVRSLRLRRLCTAPRHSE